MKIMLNRPIKKEPWGGGSHFITALYEFLSSKNHDVIFELQPNIDIIFMFDPRPSVGGDCVNSIYQYKQYKPSTKIIQRINDTDKARPNDAPWRDKLLLEANKIADHTIFISEWVKNYYLSKGFNEQQKNSVIINGCNSDWYFPTKEKKINKSKIHLITHHWSDNFMKGFDVYNFIDELVLKNDRFKFTYMGRYNKKYFPKNTTLIPPKYGPEVGDILRSADIYVTGARWEACGMHHIEAASCGLPILYHKDGGGVTETCKKHGVEFSSTDDFVERLNTLVDEYDRIKDKIDYSFLSFERCLKQYENVILDLI